MTGRAAHPRFAALSQVFPFGESDLSVERCEGLLKIRECDKQIQLRLGQTWREDGPKERRFATAFKNRRHQASLPKRIPTRLRTTNSRPGGSKGR